ncbi:MAG: hypothetical protein ACK40G_01660 [Cytophagaceae bacterium]
MIDNFGPDNMKELLEVQAPVCISIYIPTHQSGMEVNESVDWISFKNEVQKIKLTLQNKGMREDDIQIFLQPAWELIDDTGFWRNLSEGLAVFISLGKSYVYRLPISFNNYSVVASKFMLTPLIAAESMNEKFFVLTLNQYDFKLYECNLKKEIHELEFSTEQIEKLNKAVAPFPYKNDLVQDPQNPALKEQVLTRAKQNGDVFLPEYFRVVNELVVESLKDQTGPLVIAALPEQQALYRRVNKYKNIIEKGYEANAQFLQKGKIYEIGYEILRPYFSRNCRNAINRYQAMAGTGLTSVNISSIIQNAMGGRVETLFIAKDKYLWGTYDEQNLKLKLIESPDTDNYDLMSETTRYAMLNNGNVYLLNKEEMPEGSDIAAIYRY